MSVLGLDLVSEKVGKEGLVEKLSDRELNNPEGVGVDLRLGAVYQIVSGGAFIETDGKAGLGLRKGVTTKPVLEYQKNSDRQPFLTIKPGEYYLIQTIENLKTPPDLMPLVFPRGSLFRAGLLMLCTKTDPGYQGSLTFGLTNLGPFPVKLQLGARICNLVFFEIKGKTVNYRGQHQGGRVTPEKKERQV